MGDSVIIFHILVLAYLQHAPLFQTIQYRWFTFDTSPSEQVYSIKSVAVHCTWVNPRSASRGKNIQTEECVDTGLVSLARPQRRELCAATSRKDSRNRGQGWVHLTLPPQGNKRRRVRGRGNKGERTRTSVEKGWVG